jgi:hypothetical protein
MAEKGKKIDPDKLEKFKFEISRELGIVDQTNLEAPDKFKDNIRSQGRNAFYDSIIDKE